MTRSNVILIITSPNPQTKPNIINSITHSDVNIGQVVTSSVKLQQEAFHIFKAKLLSFFKNFRIVEDTGGPRQKRNR